MNRSELLANRITAVLATISPATAQQLARATGRHISSIRTALDVLVARGQVETVAGQHRRSSRDGFTPYLAFRRAA